MSDVEHLRTCSSYNNTNIDADVINQSLNISVNGHLHPAETSIV